MASVIDTTATGLQTCASCGAPMPPDAAFCPACGTPVERAGPAPAPAPAAEVPAAPAATPVPAGLMARGAAFFIDYMLLVITWSVVLGVVSAFAGDRVLGVGSVAMLAAGQLYWALFESGRRQATVGKQALALVVVNADGTRLTMNRALTRSALSVVPIVVAEVCILAGSPVVGAVLLFTVVPGAVLMAPFNERRLALHDLLTGTMVARRPRA